MQKVGQFLRRFLQKILPPLSVLVLLFAALYLAGNATSGLSGLADIYVWIFVLTGLALVVLAVAIVHRIVRLVAQVRSGAAGSRLTLRMVLLFVVLAVPPASIVYWFSIDFLGRSIDAWFDVDVESALDDSLVIAQSFLEVQERTADRQIRRLARRLSGVPDSRLISTLTGMVSESGAMELTVFERGSRVVATSSADLGRLLPDTPPQLALVQARQLGFYVEAEPSGEGLQIRALGAVPQQELGAETRILQGIFPVTAGFDERAANVQRQVDRYHFLSYLSGELKRSFVLILSLVLLLSILMAVLLAFNTARKLVMPIGRLAQATRAVAAGDYRRHIEAPADDELGFLVRSFNQMTDEIAATSQEATMSRREAEQRRDYLEAVLGRLSSGVISLDAEHRLLTANLAAGQILGVHLAEFVGRDFAEVTHERPELAALADLLHHRGPSWDGEWRRELILESARRRQVLVCRGAQLTTAENVGQVVVIDDVTDLVEAQRAAAWGEVARRLAHEVRNPLTPIQLAAERMRRRYLGSLAPEEGDLLDRSTRTIVAQVEALKTMVNAFSEYARAPTLQLEPLRLSELVDEVLDLYRENGSIAECHTHWMTAEPRVLVDRGRIRQLLHNLIKNAQEAVVGEALVLHLDTHVSWQRGKPWLTLSLRDNGPGLPRSIMDNLFEPYATTKARGTGIGLAIVKKIAEEHGGEISARNAESGGAIFELRLPAEAIDVAADAGKAVESEKL